MNKYALIILNLFFVSASFAQGTGRLAFKWRKPEAFVPIPDQFKNEDAVAIYNETGVKNDFDITNRIVLRSSYFIKRKIRILTSSGLSEYSNIVIRQRASSTVSTLDARTIKKDGKTITIKSEDIKLLRTFDDEREVYYNEYRIAIPGVEVGDEIEYIYTTYRNGLSYADDIYLHTDIACLESSFEFTLRKGLRADMFSINQMPEPHIATEENYQRLSWSLKNTPSIKHQNYSIPDKELPYIQYKVTKLVLPQYQIDEPLAIENWNQLYKELAQEDYDNRSKSKGLEAYFNSFKSITDTMKNMDKVKFFVEKINKDFTIMDNNDEDNVLKPVTYFIENKKIDETNLRSYYKYMFYYMHIPFETCFGKNRYAGDLIPQIISTHQITHVFYSFLDEQQLTHYLFLSESDLKYHADERPFSLEETKVIYLKKEDPFSNDLPQVSIRPMERMSPDANTRSISCAFTINPDWSSSTSDIKASYSGLFSLRYRPTWQEEMSDYNHDKWIEWLDQKENKGFSLDTVFIEQDESGYPFKFAARLKSKQADVIIPAGDNIQSLKVQMPVSHFTIPSYSYARITDIYMPYLFTDELIYYVKFPSGVSIINEKELSKKVINDGGAFTLQMTKISDSVYKITSTYRIRDSVLEKANYKWLTDLNEMVKQAEEINILFKKL